MQVTLHMYLIVLPMVLLASTVDAIAGGGGLISLPAYSLAGLNYDFASGNNKFSSTFGTLMATIRYYRSGKLMVVPGLIAAIAALPGSWLGTRAAMALGNRVMQIFMLFAIPIVGALVLFNRKTAEESKPVTRRQYPICALIRHRQAGEPVQQHRLPRHPHRGGQRALCPGLSRDGLLCPGRLARRKAGPHQRSKAHPLRHAGRAGPAHRAAGHGVAGVKDQCGYTIFRCGWMVYFFASVHTL